MDLAFRRHRLFRRLATSEGEAQFVDTFQEWDMRVNTQRDRQPVFRQFLVAGLVLLLSWWLLPGLSIQKAIAQQPPADLKLNLARSIGEDSPEGWVDMTGAITRLRENYYVASLGFRGEIRVFDSTGRRAFTMGRLGSGPEEFKMIFGLEAGDPDSLFVFDIGNQRLSVWMPPDRLERTAPFRLHMESSKVVALPNGTFVVNANSRSPNSFGLPLHLVGSDGEVIRSFGYVDDQPILSTRGFEISLLRETCSAREPWAVWSVAQGNYVLEKWDTRTGYRIAAYDLSRAWQIGGGDILGLGRDKDDHLIIVGRVADSRATGDQDQYDPIQNKYDTVVDLVDEATGQLIATTSLDDSPLLILSGPEVLTYSEAVDGRGLIRVWHVLLNQGG